MRYAVLILLAWCGFLFFYGLDSSPLYRTEGLRARVAFEALNGHWLVPTLYGEPFLTKPPGMYVAIAGASWPAGRITDVTARLPSALAATLTVLLIYFTFRRYLGRSGGLLAGLAMPVSALWLDKAPSAEIDMLQLMWVAASLLALLRAVEAEESGRGAAGWWAAALLCVAGGFLTKWTAPAFFYLSAVSLLAWRRRLGLLLRPGHLIGVALAALVGVGWLLAAADQAGWDTLAGTVRAEAMQRFDPNHGGRAYPWGESAGFPLKVLATCLPWSLLAIPTLSPAFLRRCDPDRRRLVQLLHCWAWPNLLFWTVMSEHAVRYAMPMTPAVTGLAVVALLGTGREPGILPAGLRRLRDRVGFPQMTARAALSGLLGLWVLVKVVHVEIVCPTRTATRLAPETAANLSRLVPEDEILYLFRLKDEGIMFYYGRPVRKLAGSADLASSERPRYVLLMTDEWEGWGRDAGLRPLRWFADQQGDRFLLARTGD